MMRRRSLFLFAPLLVALIARTSAAPDRPDITALIAHVGERVAAFYERAQQLVCIERSTVVPIASDWTVGAFARTVESELRIELPNPAGDGLAEPRITRNIRRINGREPRERDPHAGGVRDGGPDPAPGAPGHHRRSRTASAELAGPIRGDSG